MPSSDHPTSKPASSRPLNPLWKTCRSWDVRKRGKSDDLKSRGREDQGLIRLNQSGEEPAFQPNSRLARLSRKCKRGLTSSCSITTPLVLVLDLPSSSSSSPTPLLLLQLSSQRSLRQIPSSHLLTRAVYLPFPLGALLVPSRRTRARPSLLPLPPRAHGRRLPPSLLNIVFLLVSVSISISTRGPLSAFVFFSS